ncbi:DUF3427 domain-containing protein [Shimia thalassica]|uniref:DUF3427 domain-containing protein n=1 Tax=Shimia thalassica TaxID=1715693 RepID=UPI0026E361CB|nr:DUF3427 domain-containing protein [Shimia thalassica]MDO6477985.1 DUF3427 domain-containing protein [Shimia thalassica]MDO6522148.1 DUF3427 domain-containing protein [Shimia thalassica]MDP2518956.1 DUF3427 domain-containing protein [Shimia thalassica]
MTITTAALALGESYSKSELAEIFQEPDLANVREGWFPKDGQEFIPFFVTLDKENRDQSVAYNDFFEKGLFFWESQRTNTLDSKWIVKIRYEDVTPLLFVREMAKVGNKTQKFTYAGRLVEPRVDEASSRPVKFTFRPADLLDTVTEPLRSLIDWTPDQMRRGELSAGFAARATRGKDPMTAAAEILTELKRDPEYQQFNRDSERVIDTWRPIFLDPDNVTADQFREFLKYSVNKHWTGIHRQAARTVADMGRLRGMLKTLASDEGIVDRFNYATGPDIPGVGPAIASGLLIVMVDDCGVWNRVSETALKRLQLWPDEGKTKGDTYKAANQILLGLCREVDVTLWQLDSLLYHVVKNDLRVGKAAKVLSRADELVKAYQIIAAGVRYATQSDEDREVKRVLEAKSLAESCDIDALIKRLGEEQDHRCAITGLPFETDGQCKPSPDRIDSGNREYSEENVQLVCKWINFAKSNMPDADFRDLMQRAAISMMS